MRYDTEREAASVLFLKWALTVFGESAALARAALADRNGSPDDVMVAASEIATRCASLAADGFLAERVAAGSDFEYGGYVAATGIPVPKDLLEAEVARRSAAAVTAILGDVG